MRRVDRKNRKKEEILKVRNEDEHMESLLTDNAERDNLPPVLYSEYKYDSIIKHFKKYGEIPKYVVNLEMLKWCIDSGHSKYHRYCKEHFAYYLEED